MIVMLFTFVILAGIGAAIAAPIVARHRAEEKKKLERGTFIRKILTEGTPDQIQRLEDLRRREVDLRLKLMESEQVKAVLDSPEVRARLESANFDVEELKGVLASPEDDDILQEFKKLEDKLLTEGKIDQ